MQVIVTKGGRVSTSAGAGMAESVGQVAEDLGFQLHALDLAGCGLGLGAAVERAHADAGDLALA